ncbi:MAG TPA: DUF2252 family protein [Polyangiaceae bacterium]|nr:DUF2252 family protein [Polyangiaceae bacterium]
MLSIDPVRLARRQLELDRERTAQITDLFAHKVERMVASPLSFLRGSAPIFYELLERHPSLSEGPPGEGWLVGDAHIENFGAFRAGVLSPSESKETRDAERIVFGPNDFDDAFVGPWRLDVLRLVVSLLLGGREMGADGTHALAVCDSLIDAYVGTVFHRKRAPVAPKPVTRLVDRVRARTRRQLLDGHTRVVRGGRRFVKGARYRELPKKLRTKAEAAFTKYARRLSAAERPPDRALDVIDAAFRVAGTGSLGCMRIAVLVRGKGGRDGAWIFDMKEEGTPSAANLVRTPRLEPAERVATAIRACVAQPPLMIGTTRMRGASMFVRRLAPQEDKIDLQALHPEDLEPLGRYLGALLGAAHRRAAKRVPKKPWSAKDCARLLASAIALAGAHEATYLAYCALVRR